MWIRSRCIAKTVSVSVYAQSPRYVGNAHRTIRPYETHHPVLFRSDKNQAGHLPDNPTEGCRRTQKDLHSPGNFRDLSALPDSTLVPLSDGSPDPCFPEAAEDRSSFFPRRLFESGAVDFVPSAALRSNLRCASSSGAVAKNFVSASLGCTFPSRLISSCTSRRTKSAMYAENGRATVGSLRRAIICAASKSRGSKLIVALSESRFCRWFSTQSPFAATRLRTMKRFALPTPQQHEPFSRNQDQH